jgi:hypothetical protein
MGLVDELADWRRYAAGAAFLFRLMLPMYTRL